MNDATPNENHHVRDDLKAWCDGELPAWRRVRVRRHLARCASCRAEVQAMQQLHQDLKSGTRPDAHLPPALRARILTQLEEAADRPPAPAEPARPWLLRYGFVTSLAVNAALVAVLIGTGLLRDTRTAQTPHTVSAPAVSPPRTFQDQDGGVKATDKRPPRRAVSKPAPTAAHVNAQASSANNRLDTLPAKRAPLVPPTVPFGPAPAPAAPAVIAPAPVYLAGPGAGTRQAGGAAKKPEQARPKAAPVALPVNRVASAAPSPPATPAPAFGGGGFGGGGFGGAPSNGAAKFSPPATETVPPADAPHVTRMPPPAVAAPPAPGGVEQAITADSAVRAVAKPTFPSVVPARDRSTPAPVGTWPTVALPFGFDPSALGVKSVTVTWDVDERGAVSHVRFTRTGDEQVDGALRAAVYAGRYEPATRQGKPVKSRLTHTFVLAAPSKP